MRASEAHREHNEETRRLIEDLEQRNRELNEMVTAETGGADIASQTILVTSDEKLAAAADAAAAAEYALNEHKMKPTDFVRNYRILDIQDGSELEQFSDVSSLAPLTAKKRMSERQINRYDLQEQLLDGTWVPYDAPRDER